MWFAFAQTIVLIHAVSVFGQEGHVFSPPSSNFPVPAAFFPLTDGNPINISSIPRGTYFGTLLLRVPTATAHKTAPNLNSSSNVDFSRGWINDPVFGTVASCGDDLFDRFLLSPVAYGSGGAFTINLWARADQNLSSNIGGDERYLFSQSSNSSNSFDEFSPSSVQLLMMQGGANAGRIRAIVKDTTDSSATSFLDSDGRYNDSSTRVTNYVDAADGSWHMISLVVRGTSTAGGSSQGYKLYVDGDLVGKVPPEAGFKPASSSVSIDGGGPLGLNTSTIFLCSRANVVSSASNFGKFSGSLAHLSLFNAALSPKEVQALFSSVPVTGLTANGLVMLPDAGPAPVAYFPLSNYRTASTPFPTYWFYNDSSVNKSADWAETPNMGAVIDCQANANNYMTLNNVEFGSGGPFALNIWIQQRNNTGAVFQCILSAASNHDPYTNVSIYEPNQIHIYLPDAGHPAGGLVRTIVKDTDDDLNGYEDETFLDSDGSISSNDIRSTPRLHLDDGLWHQLTLTTLPGAPAIKGYSLYVDGRFMASLNNTSADGYFHVDGGHPLNTTANNFSITLCGRSDRASNRFFDGLLTQFSIFNNSLTSDQVVDLYRAVQHEDPPPASEVAAPVPVSFATTTSSYAAAPEIAAAVAASPLALSLKPPEQNESASPSAEPTLVLPIPMAPPAVAPPSVALLLPVTSIGQSGIPNSNGTTAARKAGQEEQAQKKEQKGHLSGGAIAAIVLVVLLVVSALALCSVIYVKRQHVRSHLLASGMFGQEVGFQRGVDIPEHPACSHTRAFSDDAVEIELGTKLSEAPKSA